MIPSRIAFSLLLFIGSHSKDVKPDIIKTTVAKVATVSLNDCLACRYVLQRFSFYSILVVASPPQRRCSSNNTIQTNSFLSFKMYFLLSFVHKTPSLEQGQARCCLHFSAKSRQSGRLLPFRNRRLLQEALHSSESIPFESSVWPPSIATSRRLRDRLLHRWYPFSIWSTSLFM